MQKIRFPHINSTLPNFRRRINKYIASILHHNYCS